MPETEFESDQFLRLLTDALRAGPASPEWHEAVTTLRERGDDGADELRLLVSARENLESGKEYRSVRAGPGFTRKLMTAVEEQGVPQPRQGRPFSATPTIIVVISSLVLVGAIALIGYVISRGSGTSPAIDALANTYFVNTTLEVSFDSSLPEDWRQIGSLPMDFSHGLRPNAEQVDADRPGGGIVWSQSLKADQPVQIQVLLRMQRPAEGWIAQVFVADDANFTEDRGTSPHEFAWLYQAGQNQLKVITPGGRVEAQRAPAREYGQEQFFDHAVLSNNNLPQLGLKLPRGIG